MAEPQLPTDVYNHLMSGRSPIELLMGGGGPYTLARVGNQLITNAMRPAAPQNIPTSTDQMAGSVPYRPVSGAGDRPNDDVTLAAINKRLPTGKGTTVEEITRLYNLLQRNLSGVGAAY